MISRVIEKHHDKIFGFVHDHDRTGGQLANFLEWCYDNGFFNNLTQEDIDDICTEENGIWLPMLKNNGIGIGGYEYVGRFLIGIDPIDCYDKPNQCSVIAVFPIKSKRELNRFYKFMENILDNQSPQYKDWIRNASTSWYGSYKRFE